MAKEILSGVAIACFIVALSTTIPIIGFFSVFLIPLPIFFYRVKLGRNNAAAIPLVVIFVTAVMVGGVSIDFLFLLEFVILGFALGECVDLKVSIEKTVLYTCGAVILTSAISLLFYGSFSNEQLATLIYDYVEKNLNHTLILYKNMGMPEENIRVIEEAIPQIQYVLVRIIPAMVVSTSLFVAWLNLIMAKPVFMAKGIDFPDFGVLNRWKSPEFLVWVAIGAGTLMLIPEKAVKVIGINGVLILAVIYFFQGIAIVAFFFEKKRLPRLLRVFLYSLIGFQQILLFFIMCMGFFDVWIDIRKLNKSEETSA